VSLLIIYGEKHHSDGHVPNARSIPVRELEANLEDLDSYKERLRQKTKYIRVIVVIWMVVGVLTAVLGIFNLFITGGEAYQQAADLAAFSGVFWIFLEWDHVINRGHLYLSMLKN